MNRLLCIFCLFFPLYLHQDWIIALSSRAYQYLYLVSERGYEGLGESQYRTLFSSKQKVICLDVFYTEEFERFLCAPDSFDWDVIRGDLSKRVMTAIVYLNGMPCVVKKRPRGGWVKELFYQNAAISSWNHAHKALREKIATPRPIALIEKPDYGYYITLFEGENAKKRLERGLDDSLVVKGLVRKLEETFFIHSDLSLENIVLTSEGAKFVDLDYFHRYPALSYMAYKRRLRERQRLKQSSPPFSQVLVACES